MMQVMTQADVTLGQQLNYVIGFENQGNDNASRFTIKDKLPLNVTFNHPADIDAASLPAGSNTCLHKRHHR
jgi:uncharacterized repeat protein (TIGR01451 family)